MLGVILPLEKLQFPQDWLNDVDEYVDIDQLSYAELYQLWHKTPDCCDYLYYLYVLLKELAVIAENKPGIWR